MTSDDDVAGEEHDDEKTRTRYNVSMSINADDTTKINTGRSRGLVFLVSCYICDGGHVCCDVIDRGYVVPFSIWPSPLDGTGI